MAVDQGVLEQIAAAVAAVMDTKTPSEARRSAQANLDAFQDDPTTSIGYVAALVGLPAEHDPARHYGLRLVEHAVKYGWNEFNDHQKAELKALALNLLRSGTRSIVDERKFIKEKLVDVVVSMAQADWPQAWPDFLSQLLEIGQTDATHMELVFMVLRSLSRVAGFMRDSSESLTMGRRKQLRDAYSESLATVFPLLAQGFHTSAQRCAQEPGNREPLFLLAASLDLLTALADWVPLTLFKNAEVVPTIAPLLLSPDVRDEANNLFGALLGRTHPSNTALLLSFFDNMETLFAALQNTGEAEHAFMVSLVDNLVLLGHVQLLAFRRERNRGNEHPEQALHAAFAQYVENMILVAQHPSITIKLCVIPFWRSFVRARIISSEEAPANGIVSALLQLVVDTRSMPQPSDMPAAMRDFHMAEFESEEQLVEAIVTLRRGIRHVLRFLVMLHNHFAFNFVAQFLQHVFGICGSATEFGTASPAVIALDTAAFLTNECIKQMNIDIFISEEDEKGAPSHFDVTYPDEAAEEAKVNEETRNVMGQALGALLEYDAPSAPVAERLCSLIGAFAPFLAYNKGQLPQVFTKVFSMLTYLQPGETIVPGAVCPLNPLTQDVRQRASRALRDVVRMQGANMETLLEEVWELGQQLMQQRRLLNADKVGLYKLVLEMAGKARSVTLQDRLLTSVLTPVLEQWTGGDLLGILRDPSAFLGHMCCLTPVPQDCADVFPPEHNIFCDSVFYLVAVMQTVVARAARWRTQTLKTHFSAIVPTLFTLMRTLHSLTAPEYQALVPGELRCVFSVPLGGVEFGAAVRSKMSTEAGRATALAALRNAQSWLDSMHIISYTILGSLMRQGSIFFAMPDLTETLSESVFAHLDPLPTQYLRLINDRVVLRLLLRCPRPRRGEQVVTAPLLTAWMQFMLGRLNAEWETSRRRDEGPSGISPAEEAERDAHLVRVTRGHMRLMKKMSENLPDRPPEPRAPGSQHILLTEPMTSTFLSSTCAALQWPAKTVLVFAIGIANAILPFFLVCEKYHDGLAKEMLPALIMALSAAEEEQESQVLMEMIAELYWVLTPNLAEATHAVLLGVPGVSQPELERADGFIRAASQRKFREAFDALLAGVTGANVASSLYKRKAARIHTLGGSDSGSDSDDSSRSSGAEKGGAAAEVEMED